MKTSAMRVILTVYFGENGNVVDMESSWQINPEDAVATPEQRKKFRDACTRLIFDEGVVADDDGKTTLLSSGDGTTTQVERIITK